MLRKRLRHSPQGFPHRFAAYSSIVLGADVDQSAIAAPFTGFRKQITEESSSIPPDAPAAFGVSGRGSLKNVNFGKAAVRTGS